MAWFYFISCIAVASILFAAALMVRTQVTIGFGLEYGRQDRDDLLTLVRNQVPRLSVIFIALSVLSVVAGAAGYPYVNVWAMGMQGRAEMALANGIHEGAQTFGGVDGYLRYLDAQKLQEARQQVFPAK